VDDNYRAQLDHILDSIENDIDNIIEHCKSGNYSMNEIVDELKELSNKVY
jgi:alkyl hydroperoxide reductase subunit AhpF